MHGAFEKELEEKINEISDLCNKYDFPELISIGVSKNSVSAFSADLESQKVLVKFSRTRSEGDEKGV